MRIHLFAAAREHERATRPLRSRFQGMGVANLTLPTLAALIGPGHQIQIQDEQSAPIDLRGPIDLALVTTKTCYAPRAYQIAAALRHKGVPVVIGGCHASLNPDEAAQHADTVVVGEAERVMGQLMADAEAGRLQPRYDGQQVPMSEVPRARRELLQKPYIIDAVNVSRGCNYACRFCCIRGFYGSGFRARDVSEVVDEIRPLGRRLGFLDENLVGDRAWGRELFGALAPLDRLFLGQVSADIVEEPDLIELAGRAGALGFHIGLESIAPETLASAGKGHNDVEAYTELVERCHRAGIFVAGGLIFGLDGDTPDSFADTLDAARRIGLDLAYFKIATPYPGTPFYDAMEAEGRLLTRDWSHYDGCFVTFRPAQMTPRELRHGIAWARNRFYAEAAIARRIPQYLRLRIPLWAALNMNRLAKVAYRHAEGGTRA